MLLSSLSGDVKRYCVESLEAFSTETIKAAIRGSGTFDMIRMMPPEPSSRDSVIQY